MPPPEYLRAYDEIVPGAAERIIAQGERQTAHRIALEAKVIHHDIVRAYLGLAAGFVLAVFVMGLGGYLILQGHEWAGGLLATGGLASLVGVFVYGTASRRAEREQKTEVMTGKKRKQL